MKITIKHLKELGACSDGLAWFKQQKNSEVKTILAACLEQRHPYWANWYVSNLFTRPQAVRYAIFAAELSIGIFEKQYPGDDRPRKAIEAATEWLKSQTEANRSAARSAAESAARSAAESAAWSAEYAARSAAASAAWSAEYAARSAAETAAWSATESAAWSAEYAARSAAESAAWSAEYAARSAEYAAWSAEYAARSAEYAARSAAKYAAWKQLIEKATDILGF